MERSPFAPEGESAYATRRTRRWRFAVPALAAAVVTLGGAAGAQSPGGPAPFDHGFPRTLLYTQVRVNTTEPMNPTGNVRNWADPQAADLAQWDVLVLEGSYVYWYPELLAQIKARNPECVIVLTWESAWSRQNWLQESVTFDDLTFHRDLVEDSRFTTSWFVPAASGQPLLYDESSSPTSDLFWNDPTDFCPLGPTGLRFREYMVQRIQEEFNAHPEYDGFMWDAVRHYGASGMDLNRDGSSDASAQRTAWWTAGFANAMSALVQANPSKVFLYQSGQADMSINPTSFVANLNGDVSPEFPMPFWIDQGGAGEMLSFWRKTMQYQLDWLAQGRDPSMAWISGGKEWYVIPPSQSDHYRYDWMRYTLGSSLLIGAYCAYDGGDNGHHQRWWYDEYDGCGIGKGYLGQPAGPAYAASDPSVTLAQALQTWTNRQIASTLWRRDFTNGITLVNPGFPGDRLSVNMAGGYGVWTDLTYPNLVPGSVIVDNSASFSSPAPSSAYEIDHANGRIRFVQGGGISNANEIQNILYETQNGGAVTAQLGAPFRKLLGAQDRDMNDGALVTVVTLPSTDGIVLLNPSFANAHPSVLVDDQSPEFSLTGSGWTTRGNDAISHEITGAGANRYGPTYRFLQNSSSNASAGAKARWQPNVPSTGLYGVSFYSPHETALNGSQQADSMRFVVHAADAELTYSDVDHRLFPHDWQSLGAFPLVQGTQNWVELRADGAGGYLLADSVRFRRIDTPIVIGASAFGRSTPGCAGDLAIGVNGVPTLGNASFAITCTNAPPGLPAGPGGGVLLLSNGALENPLYLAGTETWMNPYVPPYVAISVGTAGNGSATKTIPIPSNPYLLGEWVFAQFFWPDACAPGGISASNALAAAIQP